MSTKRTTLPTGRPSVCPPSWRNPSRETKHGSTPLRRVPSCESTGKAVPCRHRMTCGFLVSVSAREISLGFGVIATLGGSSSPPSLQSRGRGRTRLVVYRRPPGSDLRRIPVAARVRNRGSGLSPRAGLSQQLSVEQDRNRRAGRTTGRFPDSVVDSLRAKGIEPLFVVVGSPSWANGSASRNRGGQYYVPTDPRTFSTWVKQVRRLHQEGGRSLQRPRREVGDLERGERALHLEADAEHLPVCAVLQRDAESDPLRRSKGAGGRGRLAGFCCGVDIPGLQFLKGLIARKVKFDYVAIHAYSTEGHAPDVHWQWHANFDDIGA